MKKRSILLLTFLLLVIVVVSGCPGKSGPVADPCDCSGDNTNGALECRQRDLGDDCRKDSTLNKYRCFECVKNNIGHSGGPATPQDAQKKDRNEPYVHTGDTDPKSD